jgi:hypothetical protein
MERGPPLETYPPRDDVVVLADVVVVDSFSE